MKIFLNKLLLETTGNFVKWEYLEKFDSLIGFHISYDVTITKRNLYTPTSESLLIRQKAVMLGSMLTIKTLYIPYWRKLKTTPLKPQQLLLLRNVYEPR